MNGNVFGAAGHVTDRRGVELAVLPLDLIAKIVECVCVSLPRKTICRD